MAPRRHFPARCSRLPHFLENASTTDRAEFSGAILALLAIFLPGFLIVAGVLPYWQTLSAKDTTARSLAGVNAAVVGLLAAALYDPVWVSTVKGPSDFAIALIGFVLLVS